jgi:hypothetical protein
MAEPKQRVTDLGKGQELKMGIFRTGIKPSANVMYGLALAFIFGFATTSLTASTSTLSHSTLTVSKSILHLSLTNLSVFSYGS